jgi:hypothetical protein
MAHTTSPHSTSTSRPQLGQLRDMDARSASFGNRVRSEGEFPSIHVPCGACSLDLEDIPYLHDVQPCYYGLRMVFEALQRLY